jgi:hypothetical protein
MLVYTYNKDAFFTSDLLTEVVRAGTHVWSAGDEPRRFHGRPASALPRGHGCDLNLTTSELAALQKPRTILHKYTYGLTN